MYFDKEFEIFKKFISSNYDIDNELIKTKYVHTLSVVKVMMMLSRELNFNEEDSKLAFHLALFHDLGRFREVERQSVFNNLKFDHGAYSNKILFNDGFINNFDINEDDYLLIKKAIYFHNKKDLPNSLIGKERLFAELLRDADRIDIYRALSSQTNYKAIFDNVSSEKILNAFYNGDSIDIKDLKSRGDRVILRLGFIKLFSFKESCKVLKETGYLNEYLNIIKVNEESHELFNNIINDINRVLEGEKVYVREKI